MNLATPSSPRSRLAPRRPVRAPGARSRRAAAFTLVEMIGVLVIIMILAMAIVPSLFKEMNTAALTKEAETLAQMGDALTRLVVSEHRVPGTNTMFADLAAALGWRLDEVAANPRNNARVCMVDPALRLGTGAGATLPYTQGVGGSTNPASPRILFIGSIGAPLPAILFNPGSSASTVFNRLWNAADQTKPTGWTSSWGGDFANMVIQRVSLNPLFVQLTLNSVPSSPQPLYAVDSTTPVKLTTVPFSAWYLLGTRLALYDAATNLQTRQVLSDTLSVTNRSPYLLPPAFVYESGVWRGRLFMTSAAQRRSGVDLQAAYALFMATSANPIAKPTGGPVTQAQVTTDMYKFISNYVYWATNAFSSTKKTPVTNSLTALISDSKNYLGK